MKIGSKVRLTGIPKGLPEIPILPAKSVFERCVGHLFGSKLDFWN